LSAIGEQIEENNDKLETLTAEKKELSEASDDLSETLEALDRDIRNLNHELIVQNEAKTNLEIEKNRLIDKKDRIEEKLYNRYDMNVLMARDWLAEQHVEEKDLSRERQLELTAAIDELGHVNIQAVEEFAELDERYRFMQGQFDDLEQAKKEVESVIEDLYLSMSEQFKTGFDALADHFSRIFAILFEGGRAKLRYADPEHIMESGIELVAQPPGKNLRHISLLSGGEKSMTAIALLFSFLAVNPSPFCVIDEIDAALDDSNISRFTGYLKKIKSKSQFIIITHRKTTLTVCESVYGVSMAKSGISKLLSIRISDYTKDGNMGDISD
ncbi:MAG: AAA family ATPase, partial [Eubacteriaceae bacterium]|nr:AAA family ATPase [Eubacteriaceae bacterium]